MAPSNKDGNIATSIVTRLYEEGLMIKFNLLTDLMDKVIKAFLACFPREFSKLLIQI